MSTGDSRSSERNWENPLKQAIKHFINIIKFFFEDIQTQLVHNGHIDIIGQKK